MSTVTLLLLILLIFALVGVLPQWPHAERWGYYPSTFILVLLIILLVLVFTGRL
jgi:Protein of unknown function (DUF3309)